MSKRRRFVCLCPLLTVGLLSVGVMSLVLPFSRVWADERRSQVGDKVEAIDINGKWTNATVVKVDGQRRFVHFEGKTDYWDDWVGPDRFRAPGAASNAPAQPAGEPVEALDFNKKWTNATVLKVDGQKKFVHFEGKSDYWDEWVGPERVRAFGTTNASALQHLAPDQPGTKGLSGWIVGTRIANGAYACTFYWFQPNGHLFMSDRMPKGWADLEFSALQKADASHCGTYGIKGDRITIQMNGEAPVALGYSESVIGGNVRQPAWTFQPGQRLDGGFSIDMTSNFAGVTAVASDSWYFRADGTFKRVKVAGAMTNDTKGPHDPHPAKATAGGSDVTEGRYDFVKGRLQLTGANGQNQTLSCFATGSKTNPNLLGIEDAQYKANVDNKILRNRAVTAPSPQAGAGEPAANARRSGATVKSHIDPGRPMGPPAWTQRTAGLLGLEQTLRPRGRQAGWKKEKTKEGADKGSRHMTQTLYFRSSLLHICFHLSPTAARIMRRTLPLSEDVRVARPVGLYHLSSRIDLEENPPSGLRSIASASACATERMTEIC